MQTIAPAATVERPAAFTSLFVRYVTGQIAEPTWRQLSKFVDSVATTSLEEREAIAAFVNDVVVDLGPDAVKLPSLNEAQAVLEETRAS